VQPLVAFGRRVDERRELFPAARTELDERRQRLDLREDLASVAREEVPLGPRHAIPRQLADGLEERGAERVVEVA